MTAKAEPAAALLDTVRRLGGRRGGVLNRLLRVIGPVTRGGTADPPSPPLDIRLMGRLALAAACALLLIALGQHGGRQAAAWAPWLFWIGMVAIFLPIATRLAWPAVGRAERFVLLLLLSLALFGIKLLYAPIAFVQFDEFLHWVTANDILDNSRLFTVNPLLPVSPLYPGLEILTTALVHITGLTVYPAAMLMLCILRLVFVAALFCLYERLFRSARMAAISALVYMGNSGFISFDVQFAYESLAVVLCVLVLLADAVAAARPELGTRVFVALVLPLLAGLAVTHHMSSYFTAILLILIAGGALVRPRSLHAASLAAAAAAAAVSLPLMWSHLIGNPTGEYLGPLLESGLHELLRMLRGGAGDRQLFVAEDGSSIPKLLQITAIASVALVVTGLATGLLRCLALAARERPPVGWAALADSLAGHWRHARLVAFAALALGFPVSVALRLTSTGWEIGNRMGAFVFLGIAPVLAVAAVYLWQGPAATRRGTLAAGLCLTCLFLGGVISGSGGNALRSPYKVSADEASVEPMGVHAAAWTREWLGRGNRFATDRINRLLVATYGRQDVVTSLADGIDTSGIFLAPALTANQMAAIREGGIDYLLVDLRLSQGRPFVGHYFEQNEDEADETPPDPATLLKFNRQDRTSRIFDNGWIIIFDVRALRDQH